MVLGASSYNPPLLPFEKQIIELTGCSEAEYRYLVAEAMRRAGPRPAGYEHIPDVRMGPVVPILVNLAIGLAISAVAYLLAPKPKAPSVSSRSNDGNRQRALGSINGANRFTPTFGFDSQAELADYGDPIPVVFGRYTGTTGGILVTPKLVWSRMFSYGTQQLVKLLFVVGEQGITNGIDAPSLNGIFLGNGALDAIYDNSFAFYWKRNSTVSGFSRIKAANLLYGTRGNAAAGDPETDDDVFSCPTATSDNAQGFSSAHSLSNNAEFGCFSPIANGTAYRVNWRVISMVPVEGGEDDPENTLAKERVKIAGDSNGRLQINTNSIRGLGMSGIGRNYSRRMGITALNGATVSDSTGIEERSANIGDTITFTIAAVNMPRDFYGSNVKVDDINSELEEQRRIADDLLQIGELFMIGGTTWQVTNRAIPTWLSDVRDQQITLKCIDVNASGTNNIGLVSRRMLTATYLVDADGTSAAPYPGTAWYPLVKASKATVRNTRSCDVTELGIKSNVYQRLNGLCNFQSLPSPTDLYKADTDKIQLSSGTIASYIRRASAFTVYVRPAGVDSNGQAYRWASLGLRFVVVGNQPIDQYNFLRFRHPSRQQFEFQFIPKNGADLRNMSLDTQFWQLNATANISSQLSANVRTEYGTFQVRSVGNIVSLSELQKNKEFTNDGDIASAQRIGTYPSSVGVVSLIPALEASGAVVTALSFIEPYSSPLGIIDGRIAGFAHEIFGSADSSPVAAGSTTDRTVTEDAGSGRSVTIRYVARKEARVGHYSGQLHTWNIIEYRVVSSSANWAASAEFTIKRTLSNTNPFRSTPQGVMFEAGVKLRVAQLQTQTFVGGRAQAWYEEIFGAARTRPVGASYSVTLDLSLSNKKMRIIATSTVQRVDSHPSGQTLLWTAPTFEIVRTSLFTSLTWKVGDVVTDERIVSSGNPFYQNGAVVGARIAVQALQLSEASPLILVADREFESQSQYSDVSFYPNLVEKSNQSSPEHAITYVNEMVDNAIVPTYDRMTIAGLSLKASRNFSNIDQIRLWLRNGLPVRRFHPDDAAAPEGPSNLFCDLVFYLLTNNTAGMGAVLNMTKDNAPLVNTDDFVTTAKFLKANRLFFDGVLGSPTNLRQFISDTAPYFLCNFVISDGKFSLLPALPTTSTGEISTRPIKISQLFTAGNILEGSFELEYLSAEERKLFQAVVRYREERENQLPQERNLVVRWADSPEFSSVESFDLVSYCTSLHHAKLVGKFFLSIRKRVTHTIRFRTTPFGLSLAPGDYIKVVTEANPYSAARNGTISATGGVTSASSLSDGQYRILYYSSAFGDVQEGTMTISGGIVAETSLWGALFTIVDATTSENIYMVEQLSLAEDNTVQITASDFPCDANLSSVMAQDVINDNRFFFEI